MVIGLTGGIASGKSLVTRYLNELDIPVIDTDEIARQIVAPDQPAWQSIYDIFGPAVFLPDRELDRAALARIVFHDPDARRRLEAVTHPAIFAEVDRQIGFIQNQSPAPELIFVAVPLLFEVNAERHFTATVLIATSREHQCTRLMQTRGYTQEEAEARIDAQLPLSEKIARADYVLYNNGTPRQLRKRVLGLVRHLRMLATPKG
ncbi:MAG TPA: dephospho-CoA kinase [Armatimonadota bacterium]|nr:dephospho-CoA kinase [Armatimonadota bacterium]